MKVNLLCFVQIFLQYGQTKIVLQRRLSLRLDGYNKVISKRLTHCEMGAQSHGSERIAGADRQTAESFMFRQFFYIQRKEVIAVQYKNF